MIQSRGTSIKREDGIIIRRYTDGLVGENALERAVQRHPIEPFSPRVEARIRKWRQVWQETHQSARWVCVKFLSQSNRIDWIRLFDDSRASRDLFKAEWDAFRKTLPEEKIKTRRWFSSSKNGSTGDARVKSLEITGLTDLENTVRGCEGDWKSQNGVLGPKLVPIVVIDIHYERSAC